MGLIALLIVLAFIAAVFVSAAMIVLRYNRQLRDPQDGNSLAFRKKYPGRYIIIRNFAPVIVVGFCFNAAAAAIGFVYVVVRWLIEVKII